MWSIRRNRIYDVMVVVVIGAIVSVLNTLWLRKNLLLEVQKIAKNSEINIVEAKVTDISTKTKIKGIKEFIIIRGSVSTISGNAFLLLKKRGSLME